MDTKASSENRFALLIDADNVSAKYIKPITDELSKYGTVTIKRIYGDWTLTLHAKWKDTLLENSITPIQQFGYTQGKNATDSAMIIDAMDILYGGSVDGFCIVSSDSDFTRLASRLRESGLTVIGMGEKKTPTAFRKACDIFTTLELLLKGTGGRPGNGHDRGHGGAGPSIKDVEQAVVSIVTDNLNNGKATGLGEVGSRLLKRYPDFDVRSYGTNQLKKLLGEFPGRRGHQGGKLGDCGAGRGQGAAPGACRRPARRARAACRFRRRARAACGVRVRSRACPGAGSRGGARGAEEAEVSPRRTRGAGGAAQEGLRGGEGGGAVAGRPRRRARAACGVQSACRRIRAACGTRSARRRSRTEARSGARRVCGAEAQAPSQARQAEGAGARKGRSQARCGARAGRVARIRVRAPRHPRAVHPPACPRGGRRGRGVVGAGQARARAVPHVQAA